MEVKKIETNLLEKKSKPLRCPPPDSSGPAQGANGSWGEMEKKEGSKIVLNSKKRKWQRKETIVKRNDGVISRPKERLCNLQKEGINYLTKRP